MYNHRLPTPAHHAIILPLLLVLSLVTLSPPQNACARGVRNGVIMPARNTTPPAKAADRAAASTASQQSTANTAQAAWALAPSLGTPRAAVTLDAFKAALIAEGRGRTLSQTTPDELDALIPTPGGVIANLTNGEYVVRIGLSTFIINMPLVAAVCLAAFLIVTLFFTPVGLWLGRGGLHAACGALLTATGIAPDFGRHLSTHPRAWLRREGSVRRAFAKYMHNEFIPEYKNNITAVAFLGTAFLIMSIGLRGIKFMSAHQPDLIIIAIVIEMTVLCLLGLTTWYEKQITATATATEIAAANGVPLDVVNILIERMKSDLADAFEQERHGARTTAGDAPLQVPTRAA